MSVTAITLLTSSDLQKMESESCCESSAELGLRERAAQTPGSTVREHAGAQILLSQAVLSLGFKPLGGALGIP